MLPQASIKAGTNEAYAKGLEPALSTLIGLVAPGGLPSVGKAQKAVDAWVKKKIISKTEVSAALTGAATAAKAALAKAAALAVGPPSQVRAVFGLTSGKIGELELTKGSVYKVQKQIDENWYQGVGLDGAIGMFPVNYVQPILEEEYADFSSVEVPVVASAGAAGGKGTTSKEANGSSKRRKFEYHATLGADSSYSPSLPSTPSPPGSPLLTGYRRIFGGYQNLQTGTVTTVRPIVDAPTSVSAVHIFDLDETLIQFNRLLAGRFTEAPGGLASTGKPIGEGLEKLILHISDKFFFFEQLERCNQVSTAALAKLDDGRDLGDYDFASDDFRWPEGPAPGEAHPIWSKLAFRHREMAMRYTRFVAAASESSRNKGQSDRARGAAGHVLIHAAEATTPNGHTFPEGTAVTVHEESATGWSRVKADKLEGWVASSYLATRRHSDFDDMASAGLLESDEVAAASALHDDLRIHTQRWLDTAIRLLDSLTAVPGSVAVMVTNSELSPALAKTLLFRLGKFFLAENIYSSSKVGKDFAFSVIQQRFGKAATYRAYGDGEEEQQVSSRRGVPFWRISTVADLRRICREAELAQGQLRPI